MHRHLLQEFRQILVIDISHLSWVTTKPQQVFIVTDYQLIIFGQPHIHFKHLTSGVFNCLNKSLQCIFWSFCRTTPMSDQVMGIAWLFRDHLKFVSWCVKQFWVLHKCFTSQKIPHHCIESFSSGPLPMDKPNENADCTG